MYSRPINSLRIGTFLLGIFQLHSLTSCGVSSFTFMPSSSRQLFASPRCHQTPLRTSTAFYLSNLVTDDDDNDIDIAGYNHEEERDDDADNALDRPVTLMERARIISYRIAMSASALCLCVQAVDDIGFLEGTGANIDQLVEQSSNALPILAGGTLSLSPIIGNKIVEIGRTSLGIAAVVSGFFLNMSVTQELTGNISWTLSVLALMAVSIREIYYFGVEYKQECIITLLTLALMFDHSNHIPFTYPLCALGMSILAAGKLFEPCAEDLSPSNSEFLAK